MVELPFHAPVHGTISDRLVRGLEAMTAGEPHEPLSTLLWLAKDSTQRLSLAEAERTRMTRRLVRVRDALNDAS